MRIPVSLKSVAGLLMPSSFILAMPTTALSSGPELWFYEATNLAVTANVSATKKLIDRAALAGYTNLLLADTKMMYDGHTGPWDSRWGYRANLQSVIKYASGKGIRVVPATFEVGRADWLLIMAQDLLEGQKVKGTNYVVSSDRKTLNFSPQNPTVANLGFESGVVGWAMDLPRVSIDGTVSHGGKASLTISAGGGRGLGIQTLAVTPFRQYHVGYWVKTSGLKGDVIAKIYDPALGVFREANEYDPILACASTQGWTHYDFVFNSGASSKLELRLGSWGATTGTLWFDDVTFSEIGLHNVVRNTKSPLKVYRSNGQALTEGKEFDSIREPFVPGTPTFALFRPPLVPTLPSNSTLNAGDRVQIDYDAAQPVYGCFAVSATEPAVKTFFGDTVKELRNSFPKGSAFALSGFDEVRCGNTATGEITSGLAAGTILGQCFTATYNLFRAQDSTAPIYAWSDMFDPLHNAVKNYYLWNGDLSGSWKGVPKDVTILNWNLGNLTNSLKFFSNLGSPQIIAGYYDSGDGYQTAQTEVKQSAGISGVRGAMYTTWVNDYSQLENFAKGVLKAWPNR